MFHVKHFAVLYHTELYDKILPEHFMNTVSAEKAAELCIEYNIISGFFSKPVKKRYINSKNKIEKNNIKKSRTISIRNL